MIYSHNVEENKFNSFALFLNQLINGQTKYKYEVDLVLQETNALAKGDKNLYQIDRDKLSIVLYLKNSDPEFFKGINVSNLQKDVYIKALESIKDKGLPFMYEQATS